MRWRTVILGGVHDVIGRRTGTSHRDTTGLARKGTAGLGDDPSNDANVKREWGRDDAEGTQHVNDHQLSENVVRSTTKTAMLYIL
jgi:hypothetical protein